MSCTGERNRQSRLLERAARVASGGVAGAATCLYPGCGQPLTTQQECPRGHSQCPGDVGRALLNATQEWRTREQARPQRDWGQGATLHGWDAATARAKAALAWGVGHEVGDAELEKRAEDAVQALDRLDSIQALAGAEQLLQRFAAGPLWDEPDQGVLIQLGTYLIRAEPPVDLQPILARVHARVSRFRSEGYDVPAEGRGEYQQLVARLAELETYDETLGRLQRRYPEQFLTEDHALRALFFTGCGFDWVGGQLVDSWPTLDEEITAREAAHAARMRELDEQDAAFDAQLRAAGREPPPREPVQPYVPPPVTAADLELDAWSDLQRVPENVTPSWRGAALRAIALARRLGWDDGQDTLDTLEWRLWHLGAEKKPERELPTSGVWADETERDSQVGGTARDWQRELQLKHELSNECWDSEGDTFGQVRVRIVRGQYGTMFEGYCSRCGCISEADYEPDPDFEARIRY